MLAGRAILKVRLNAKLSTGQPSVVLARMALRIGVAGGKSAA